MDEQTHQMLQMEALRRYGNLGNSSAGVGAEAANAQTPQNPIANAGQTPPQQPPMAESMYQGAAGMMNGANKGEASIILKALIKRLHQHPVEGQ